MYKPFFVLLSIFFLISSCTGGKNTEEIIIASQEGDCMGVAPQKCLLIKTEGKDNWEFLYTGIDGFNYEPGYEYKLEVKKEMIDNPAADQSSIRYILVKEVSKVKKDSDNLPVNPERKDRIVEDMEITD